MNKKHLQILEQIAQSPLAPDNSLSERRWKVYAMRRLAITWDKIAEMVGVSESTVRSDHRIFMKELVSETREDMIADAQALMRDIIRADYVSAMAGDIESQKMLIRASQETSKLFGLYAPTRVDHGISEREFASDAIKLIREIGFEPPRSLLEQAGHESVVDAEIVETSRDEFSLPVGYGDDESPAPVSAEPSWSNL